MVPKCLGANTQTLVATHLFIDYLKQKPEDNELLVQLFIPRTIFLSYSDVVWMCLTLGLFFNGEGGLYFLAWNLFQTGIFQMSVICTLLL